MAGRGKSRFIGLKVALEFIPSGDDSETECGYEDDESDDNFEPEVSVTFCSDDDMAINEDKLKATKPVSVTPEEPSKVPHVTLENDEVQTSDEEAQEDFITHKQKVHQKMIYHWCKKEYESETLVFEGEQVPPPADGFVGTPLQYFKTFISDEMVQLVVDNTNLYSVQKNGKSITTTTKEMEQVFGMFFHMGIVCMPGTRVYWENETQYGPVADIMSRNRFQSLLILIHFVDNLGVFDVTKKADKLWKICSWLAMLWSTCLKITMEETNSIDEMMVSYKGTFSGIKQYMRGKPHPWGFKIWCRTGVSGMLYDFDVYQGGHAAKRKTNELGLAGDVVMNLCSTLPIQKSTRSLQILFSLVSHFLKGCMKEAFSM